jgi:hypothetical protein
MVNLATHLEVYISVYILFIVIYLHWCHVVWTAVCLDLVLRWKNTPCVEIVQDWHILISFRVFMSTIIITLVSCVVVGCVIIIIIIVVIVSCHRPFLPGTSLEPAVTPTAQASSFTLQYFPYYVWCSKYSCLL